jgi:hypothetical protein
MVYIAGDPTPRSLEALKRRSTSSDSRNFGEAQVQCGRQLTDAVDGFLLGKRFLLHDRDRLFSDTFRETLAATGVETLRLPPRPESECARGALCAHHQRRLRESADLRRRTVVTTSDHRVRHP